MRSGAVECTYILGDSGRIVTNSSNNKCHCPAVCDQNDDTSELVGVATLTVTMYILVGAVR